MGLAETTVAVVTGGASGIGLALAAQARARVDVVVVADVDEAALHEAVAQLSGGDAQVLPFVVDIRDAVEVSALAEFCEARGRVALAFFNAGVSATGSTLWETPPENIRFMFDVIVDGTLNCIRAFVPRLVASDEPAHVIITASVAGLVSSPYTGAYAAAKAGTVALAKTLREELASAAPHVGVVATCPGMVRTNLMRNSARQREGIMPGEVAEAGHASLEKGGILPAAQAQLVFDAVDRGTFWVLPPTDDPLYPRLVADVESLAAEVAP